MKEEAFLMIIKLIKFYRNNRQEILSAVALLVVFGLSVLFATSVLG
jgi:hypothetical protein